MDRSIPLLSAITHTIAWMLAGRASAAGGRLPRVSSSLVASNLLRSSRIRAISSSQSTVGSTSFIPRGGQQQLRQEQKTKRGAAPTTMATNAAAAARGASSAKGSGSKKKKPAPAANDEEVPSGMEHEARLLEELLSIPQITKATVRPAAALNGGNSGGVQIWVHSAQHNLPANSKRQLLHTVHVPDAAAAPAGAFVSGLPVELPPADLQSVSPSGRRMLVARGGGAGGNSGGGAGDAAAGVLLELWEGGRLVRELQVPKALHGAVVNDGWFSRGAAWSDDERRICYVAEVRGGGKGREAIGRGRGATSKSLCTRTLCRAQRPARSQQQHHNKKTAAAAREDAAVVGRRRQRRRQRRRRRWRRKRRRRRGAARLARRRRGAGGLGRAQHRQGRARAVRARHRHLDGQPPRGRACRLLLRPAGLGARRRRRRFRRVAARARELPGDAAAPRHRLLLQPAVRALLPALFAAGALRAFLFVRQQRWCQRRRKRRRGGGRRGRVRGGARAAARGAPQRRPHERLRAGLLARRPPPRLPLAGRRRAQRRAQRHVLAARARVAAGRRRRGRRCCLSRR